MLIFCHSYPALYIISNGPQSVVRWMKFSNEHSNIPYQATLFANTFYGLSGFFNCILFAWTRPTLVVGEKVTIERDEESRDEKASPRPQNSLGYLPTRKRQDSMGEMEPVLRSSGSNHEIFLDQHIQHSPSESSCHATLPASGSGVYLSLDRTEYRRSAGSSSVTEEGDCGYLPHSLVVK